jgi:hypothetical protein
MMGSFHSIFEFHLMSRIDGSGLIVVVNNYEITCYHEYVHEILTICLAEEC